MSIGSLLNISKDSLQSYQLAIDLTGGNIANVNTPGYSRQRAVFNAVGTVDVGSSRGQIGVNVASIERIYDEHLDNQVAEQAQLLGYNEARSELLNRVEGIFAEKAGGASDLLNKFWNAWSELAANPQGQVERENLFAAAEDVASVFRRMDGDLTKVLQDAGEVISNIVSQANDYLSQVADLNSKITSVGNDRGETNLLKDKRSDLINKLSNYLDIQYVTDAKGAINIFLADGRPLLTGDNVWKLAETTGPSNTSDIVYENDSNISLASAISGGKKGRLAALLEIGDTIAPGYRERLDDLVNNLVTEVNAQHAKGYDISGNAGGDFFDPATTGAIDLRVADAISSDVNKIAASSTVNGDGDNARLIFAIKDDPVLSGGTATINDYFASLIGRIGRDVAGAKSGVESQRSIMEQLSNRREATSGVSLDEEMMDLMKYQMSYTAAGKLVSTVNQLMDVMMQLVK